MCRFACVVSRVTAQHSQTPCPLKDGDTSGMMGFSNKRDNYPRQCFNAAKSYVMLCRLRNVARAVS